MFGFGSDPQKDVASKALDAMATHRKQQAAIYTLKGTTDKLILDLKKILDDIKKIRTSIQHLTGDVRSTITDYNIQLTKLTRILNETHAQIRGDEILSTFAMHLKELADKLSTITAAIRGGSFKNTQEISEQVANSFNSAILQDIETALTNNLHEQERFSDQLKTNIANSARPAS